MPGMVLEEELNIVVSIPTDEVAVVPKGKRLIS